MDPAEVPPIAVAEFDSAPAADAAAELMPCCTSRRWISGLVSGRPYARLDRLTAASDALLATLDRRELAAVLAGEPRAGERSLGGHLAGRWSRPDQPDAVREQLAAASTAYEQRFGHPFLISASGLSAGATLTALRSRLRNDPVAEREVVRGELVKLVRLRLARAFR